MNLHDCLGKLFLCTGPVIDDQGRACQHLVFRANGIVHDKVLLGPPKKTLPYHPVLALPVDLRPVFEGVYEPGMIRIDFCRFCGCTGKHGCDPDSDGMSCSWANAEHTICTRCMRQQAES